ncbi:E3 SUMO-protein ligase ZBED1-like [Temnothorax nylanderi]|uniref:E3 SUMO-protein ligase ZBED1-like n=1 Tax=Temnothorax nylanderi TaxID=102681 RepID=UPI003A870E70
MLLGYQDPVRPHDPSDHEENTSVEEQQNNIRDNTDIEQDQIADLFPSKRKELIHQALAKMIAINQMPISFCSSEGFRQFMTAVDPGYSPCKDEALKKRLNLLKDNVEEKIKVALKDAVAVSCTTDCWSSLTQHSYVTLIAHMLDENWTPKCFTLGVYEMEERHTAANLASRMEELFVKWNINEKVMAVVTDNATNIINATHLLHLQLAVNKALVGGDIEKLLVKSSKIVSHFKHSNVAKYALQDKQEQLGLPTMSLLQSCKTRWNSSYFMLERLLQNRIPVMNVLTDRRSTTASVAESLEISEREWTLIEALLTLLKPLQLATTVLCGDNSSPVSMVRPVLQKTLQNHMQIRDEDDVMIKNAKEIIANKITQRFALTWTSNNITARQIASMMDPRFKDLDHEPFEARLEIRGHVKYMLQEVSPVEDTCSKVTTKNSALEFLYQQEINNNDIDTQWQRYLSEPQLRFDLDPFEWWNIRKDKLPAISYLARRYLSIPASSASSERCFSTAEFALMANNAAIHD